jgi:hypothetical protein
MESPEINPCIYEQLIFDKEYAVEKLEYLEQTILGKLNIHTQRNEIGSSLLLWWILSMSGSRTWLCQLDSP